MELLLLIYSIRISILFIDTIHDKASKLYSLYIKRRRKIYAAPAIQFQFYEYIFLYEYAH